MTSHVNNKFSMKQFYSLKIRAGSGYNANIMKTFKEALGTKIREYRKSRGLTQEKLAEIIDVNQRQLVRIESGENYPSAETFEKICLALEISPDALFKFEWQIKEKIMKTGTYNVPVLSLVKKDENVTVKTESPALKKEFSKKRTFPSSKSELSMIETARKIGTPIKVQYFDGRQRDGIKVYNPDGTIETLVSQEDIKQFKIYDDVLAKLKKISADKQKLEFINLALEAFSDKEALQELMITVKGMLLLQDK